MTSRIRLLAALLVLTGSVAAPQVITTFAGSDFLFTGDGQLGVNVALAQPTFLAFDASGSLYIADSTLNTLVKLNPSSGIVSVVAGNGLNGLGGEGGPARNALLGAPAGIAIDSAGNIYVAQQNVSMIQKITPDGNINTFAGSGQPGFSGDGGPALKATLNLPSALAVDSQGNLYVYSTNGPRIRKIDTAGIITTIAGNGQNGVTGNGGPGASAELSGTGGLTVDSQGNLYIADLSACQVRRLDATTGIITAFAGTGACGSSGGDNGPALKAQINQPSGVAFDAQGNLYISELLGNRVRRVDPSGNITTVAGTGAIGFGGDGGSATQAIFSAPRSVAVDSSGNIWVADRDNQRVRKFQVGGNIATAVGIGASLGDGGPASGAKFLNAFSIARDGSGNVYVADFGNSRIRKISLGGAVSTIAGTGRTGTSPDGTLATSANLYQTGGVAVDPQGNVVFADSGNSLIRRIKPDGTLQTIAGTGAFGGAGDGGLATSASLAYPEYLIYDSSGNLYFVTEPTGGGQVRVVSASGTIHFVAGNGQTAFSGDGGLATSAGMGQIIGLAVDSGGNLYILDMGDERLRKVTPGGIISTIAGTGSVGFSPDGTKAIQASLGLSGSGGVAIDSSGRILFPDNNRIRAIQADGTLTTLAGSGNYSFSGDGGPPLAAAFQSPTGMVFDASGNLLISDTGNTRIREVFQTSAPIIVPSQSGLIFTTATGVAPQPQTFTILNGGFGVLSFGLTVATSSGGNWLSISTTSGSASSNAPGVPVTVNVDPSQLSAGDYYGTITVGATGVPNSPQVVTVVLHLVSPAALPTDVALNPGGLIFTGAQGGSAPASQPITLSTSSSQTLNYTASVSFGSASFLTLSNPTGTVTAGKPVTFTIAPNIAGLTAGVYSATLSLTASPAPTKQISIFLVIGPPGTPTSSARPATTASCAPTKLLPVLDSLSGGFNVIAAWPIPLEVRIVDDCGNPTTTGSVVASFSTTDPPLSLNSLQNGSWAATWQTSSAAAQVTVTITATTGKPTLSGKATVAGGLAANQNAPPSVAQGGVLNAASFQLNTAVSPGSLVSIFGLNLASSVAVAGALPLPDDIDSTEVVLAGRSLPLVFVSSGQINAQIPYDVPANTTQQIVVTRGGSISVPQPVAIATAAGGVFTQNSAGTGTGIIVLVNADGSQALVSAANPATAGSVLVVYATGLGDVNPRILAGDAVPLSPLSQTNAGVTVTIGGKAASIFFAGPTPGFTGLYQINLTVPPGVTTGAAVPLVVTQGNSPSPPVTLPIH